MRAPAQGVRRLAGCVVLAGLAWGAAACAGPAIHPRELSWREAERRVADLLAAPGSVPPAQALERLERWLPAVRSPELRRRARRVLPDLREATVEPAVRQAVGDLERRIRAAYRRRVVPFERGRRTPLGLIELLDREPEVDRRREAWMSLGHFFEAVSADLRRLFEARNERARRAGYAGESARVEAREEIDAVRFESIADSMIAALGTERGFGGRPWNLRAEGGSLFDRRLTGAVPDEAAIDAVRDLLVGMGFGVARVEAVLALDRERVDSRALAEIGGLEGVLFRAGRTLYHEHLPDGGPPELRRPASRAMEAAVGRFFARFASDRPWLRGAFPEAYRLADPEAPPVGPRITALRWLLARVEFEREAYRNPGRDLDELWWDLAEKRVGWKRFEGVADWARDPDLARDSFLARDDLLARLIASQLQNYVILAHGSALRGPGVADFFREKIFAAGASRPPHELLLAATGEPLNPAYHLREAFGEADRESLEKRLERRRSRRSRSAPPAR